MSYRGVVRAEDARTRKEAWYRGGLRFECKRCGNCCSGAPGNVYVTREEIERIAAFIGREGRGLTSRHLRTVGRRFSLTEDRDSGDCCFLRGENGHRVCCVYPVRPLQCRTWPFWDTNLRSSRAWLAASVDCPGMNTGRHHDFAQIEFFRKARHWKDLLP